MMLVRFPEFRRERTPEWVLAAATLGWGINALIDLFMPIGERHTMDSPFFAPLLATGVGQAGWGIYATGVGLVHLAALHVNGSRPKGSTMARAVGSALSTFFWGGLVVGVLSLPWRSGALFSYGAIAAIGGFSLYYAAREVPVVIHRARATANGR